jgi:hypothetical protein
MAAVGTAARADETSVTADAIFLRLGESIGTFNTCITIGAIEAPIDRSKTAVENFSDITSKCNAFAGRYIAPYAAILTNSSINELIITEEEPALKVGRELFQQRYDSK